MQGTILIIDGVATNRIMLKVQLSAAYYHVVQCDGVDAVLSVAKRSRPDLILTAMKLPDGNALDVRRILAADDSLADIPLIAMGTRDDPKARLAALSTGIDDVLLQPLDDVILQARIRSLMRARGSDDLTLQHEAAQALALPLSQQACLDQIRGASVALVTNTAATAAQWKQALQNRVPYRLSTLQIGNIHPLMTAPVPDVIVVELNEAAIGPGLRLLTDLRSRAATRQSVVIAIPNPRDPHVAAEALDRGAHDVLQGGFNVDELALRLSTQLQYKARNDHKRDNLRDGLRAAIEDPMTGLYNRRYAESYLDRTALTAADRGESFALMLIDLDHFKRINDQFGHPAGDAVLVETANRLRKQLRPVDLLARVGGEEFMVVIPNIGEASAQQVADRLCRQINSTGFTVPGQSAPIPVTTSIGVIIGGPGASTGKNVPLADVAELIAGADRALYKAKHAGRNQVTLSPVAA